MVWWNGMKFGDKYFKYFWVTARLIYFFQYAVCLHLSIKNVWGLTFFWTHCSYIWTEKLRIRSMLQLQHQPQNATNTYTRKPSLIFPHILQLIITVQILSVAGENKPWQNLPDFVFNTVDISLTIFRNRLKFDWMLTYNSTFAAVANVYRY